MKHIAMLAALLCGAATAAPAMATECRDDPAVVSACFTVHGRLSLTAHGIQVWPSGTKRLLQLEYPAELPQALIGWPYIPARLDRMLRAGQADVWGDFDVCPLTYDIPGQLRLVCIQSGQHLATVDNPRRPSLAAVP